MVLFTQVWACHWELPAAPHADGSSAIVPKGKVMLDFSLRRGIGGCSGVEDDLVLVWDGLGGPIRVCKLSTGKAKQADGTCT